jgi:hypothetical protein
MREFAGARFGVSREELGKWNEEGFTASSLRGCLKNLNSPVSLKGRVF